LLVPSFKNNFGPLPKGPILIPYTTNNSSPFPLLCFPIQHPFSAHILSSNPAQPTFNTKETHQHTKYNSSTYNIRTVPIPVHFFFFFTLNQPGNCVPTLPEPIPCIPITFTSPFPHFKGFFQSFLLLSWKGGEWIQIWNSKFHPISP